MTDAPQAETGYVEVGGAPLYYEVAGAGHPLVLIHEGFTDSRMYDDQFAAFAARHRVIRYDLHGSGRSGLPAAPQAHHNALRDLLRHLGVARAAVLGMSVGGGVAVDFALAHPALVGALIAVAPVVGGYPVSEAVRAQWGAFAAALTNGDTLGAVERVLRMWVDGPGRAPEQVDPAVRARVRALLRHWVTLPRYEPRPLKPPALGRLAEIRVPTLVIAGGRDQADILAQADLLHRGIAGARRANIPDTAHVPNLERPAEFNRLVLDFLDTVSGAA